MSKSKRITEVIRVYHEKLSGDRVYPDFLEVDINSNELSSIKDSLLLVSVKESDSDPVYDILYIGSKINEIIGSKNSNSSDIYSSFYCFYGGEF